MTALEVSVLRFAHAGDLPLPARATAHSAGVDLLAAVDRTLRLEPGERVMVPSGIAIALPEGYEAQVRPRSGLAAKLGLTILNSPGTVDADYRGEICVILINLGKDPVQIERGMRIAQLIIAPVMAVRWREVPLLPESGRGEGGFGSTGIGSTVFTGEDA